MLAERKQKIYDLCVEYGESLRRSLPLQDSRTDAAYMCFQMSSSVRMSLITSCMPTHGLLEPASSLVKLFEHTTTSKTTRKA